MEVDAARGKQGEQDLAQEIDAKFLGVKPETHDPTLLAVLDLLAENPDLCSHLEMETYTWEVLPPELKSRSVVEQLAAEYEWLLPQLAERGLASR